MTVSKIFGIKVAGLAACAALLLLQGCQKQWDGYQKGEVSLSAASASSAATKAVWGDDIPTGEHKGVQRIDWKSGDQIRIASNYAKALGGADQATYAVSGDGTHKSESDPFSYAKLTPNNSGLKWEETKLKAEHQFWGVYPAREITTEGADRYIEGLLPDDNLLLVSKLAAGDKSLVSAEEYDMLNQPGSTIMMHFFPAFTTMQIKLTNETAENLSVKRFKITSKEPIQGKFKARIADEGVDNVTMTDPDKTGKHETIVTGGEAPEVTIWTGPQSSDFVIPASTFAPAVGRKVNVYMTKSQDYFAATLTYPGFYWGDADLTLPELHGNNYFSKENLTQGYTPAQDVQSYFSFTLSDDVWNKVSSKGLTINRLEKLRLHKLTYSDGASEKSIWAPDGDYVDNVNNGVITIQPESLSPARGHEVRVYITITDIYYWFISFQYKKAVSNNSYDNLSLPELNNSATITSNNAPGSSFAKDQEESFSFKLTSDVWEKISEGGEVKVQWMENCSINRITYEGEPTEGTEETLYYEEDGDKGARSLGSTETAASAYFSLLPKDIVLQKLIVEFSDGSTKSMDISDITFDSSKQYRLNVALPGSGQELQLVSVEVKTVGQQVEVRDYTGSTWQ